MSAFGSFYNHFESKEAIYSALTEQFFEEFADALDRALAGVTDPAEVLAASMRHTLYRARHDATWARFPAARGAFRERADARTRRAAMRDIQKGIERRAIQDR